MAVTSIKTIKSTSPENINVIALSSSLTFISFVGSLRVPGLPYRLPSYRHPLSMSQSSNRCKQLAFLVNMYIVHSYLMRNSSGIVTYCGNCEMAFTLGRAAMRRSSEGCPLSNYPTATFSILLQMISDMSPPPRFNRTKEVEPSQKLLVPDRQVSDSHIKSLQ